MLCDHCGKNQASVSVKQTVNGLTKTSHLCKECSKQLKLSGFFGTPFFNTADLFSGLFDHSDFIGEQKIERCPKCGATLQEILSTGHLGCVKCVETFDSALLPTIRKIHGNARHTGKIPKTASIEIKNHRQIEGIEEQLKKAIALQNFEEAAKLRDEIKLLKEEEEKK